MARAKQVTADKLERLGVQHLAVILEEHAGADAILRLALLAPDVIDAILAGQADQALLLESLERPLPASWEKQRRHPELA